MNWIILGFIYPRIANRYGPLKTFQIGMGKNTDKVDKNSYILSFSIIPAASLPLIVVFPFLSLLEFNKILGWVR